MPRLEYYHLDVFTDRLFGGNQLAVYLEPPADLTPAIMQSIAREMNYSETTFVFDAGESSGANQAAPATPAEAGSHAGGAAEAPDWRVRIFTPGAELPMAGHPTIGTAFALAAAGRVRPDRARVVFALGVGPVPVDLEWAGGSLRFAWMSQPAPVFGPVFDDRGALAVAVGLEPGELAPGGWPVQEVGCGVPFLLVPVATRAAVDRAAADGRALATAFQRCGRPQRSVYLFTLEGGADGADVYTRMFAPEIGIPEDPATGGASGPLGAYLVHHGILGGSSDRVVRNLQGVAMGRPSWIHIAAAVEGQTITAMRVGGTAVLAGTGSLDLT